MMNNMVESSVAILAQGISSSSSAEAASEQHPAELVDCISISRAVGLEAWSATDSLGSIAAARV